MRQAGRGLTTHKDLDDPYHAHTWSCLGDIHQQRGEPAQAIACYQQAFDLFHALGARHAEATTLAQLGASYHAAGDPNAAWEHTRDLIDDLDEPAADQLRIQLHQLDQTTAAGTVVSGRDGT